VEVEELSLSESKLVTPDVYGDDRGFFFEPYQETRYVSHGINKRFVQDNISFSVKGVLRGMHYQKGDGQAKLVTALTGEIFDVAMDIRMGSPTFGKCVGVKLDDKKRQQLYIPEGFAHCFCVLSADAHVSYKVSTPYIAELETGFHYEDADIVWPIEKPILSKRDQMAPRFREVEV